MVGKIIVHRFLRVQVYQLCFFTLEKIIGVSEFRASCIVMAVIHYIMKEALAITIPILDATVKINN